MKFRLIEDYIIKGLICPGEQKLVIEGKNIKAYLTQNPDELLNKLDIKNAIANLLLQSTFIGRPEGNIKDLIDSRVKEIRSQRAKGSHLIIEAIGELKEYKPSVEKEQDGLHLAFDAVDGNLLSQEFISQINSVLTTLTLVSDKVIGIDKINEGIILYKNENEIIYSYTFEGGSSFAYSSSQIENSLLGDLPKLFNLLNYDDELNRITDLLATSLKARNEQLKAFLTCWTALEIFVNKYFKVFNKEFFTELKAGEHPDVREQYLDRISEVMKDKYKLNDKFGIIALRLSPKTADRDVDIFNILKKQRDDMAHGQNINERELDVINTQHLLTKYLKLFLYYQAD